MAAAPRLLLRRLQVRREPGPGLRVQMSDIMGGVGRKLSSEQIYPGTRTTMHIQLPGPPKDPIQWLLFRSFILGPGFLRKARGTLGSSLWPCMPKPRNHTDCNAAATSKHSILRQPQKLQHSCPSSRANAHSTLRHSLGFNCPCSCIAV